MLGNQLQHPASFRRSDLKTSLVFQQLDLLILVSQCDAETQTKTGVSNVLEVIEVQLRSFARTNPCSGTGTNLRVLQHSPVKDIIKLITYKEQM